MTNIVTNLKGKKRETERERERGENEGNWKEGRGGKGDSSCKSKLERLNRIFAREDLFSLGGDEIGDLPGTRVLTEISRERQTSYPREEKYEIMRKIFFNFQGNHEISN